MPARDARPDLKVLFITGYAENAIIGNGQLAPGHAGADQAVRRRGAGRPRVDMIKDGTGYGLTPGSGKSALRADRG